MSDTKPRSPSDTSQVVAAWGESTAKRHERSALQNRWLWKWCSMLCKIYGFAMSVTHILQHAACDCWLHRANFNNITTMLCTSTYLLWCEGQEGIMDPLFLCWPLPYYCSSKPIQLVTKQKLLKRIKKIYPKKAGMAEMPRDPSKYMHHQEPQLPAALSLPVPSFYRGACHGIQALSLHLASTTSSSISRNSWWQSLTLGRHERKLAS